MSFLGDVLRETGIKIFSTILMIIIFIVICYLLINFVDWKIVFNYIADRVIEKVIN